MAEWQEDDERALTEEEFRKAAAAVNARSQEPRVFHSQKDAEKYAEDMASGFGIPVEQPQEPVDLTDPLAHIRAMIVGDIPKAAFATDEELETLYDQWQAQQENDDDRSTTQEPV